MTPRRLLLLALGVLPALLLPNLAVAKWQPSGSGRAYSKGGAMSAGATPSASVAGRNVTLSWSPNAGPPGVGYILTRLNGAGTAFTPGADCAGTLTATSCTEKDLAPGQWRYTVTPALGNWRGAASAPSTAVTVASPSLSLAPTTVNSLPATLSGQIASYLEAQTLTYRLDNATTGTVLSATTTPSTVPASGTASVSVTLPAGTADGVHTIYAVGSRGDVSQAPITVAAACSAPGAQTVLASQDSYVDSLLSGQNFGTAVALEVGPSYLLLLAQQKALVQFELPAVPARCTLVGASLRLYATKPTSGRTIEALPVSAAWTEAGVTWANQPATSGTAATSASLAAPGFETWTVLNQVKAMYSGANNGFLIKDSVANGVLPPHQTYQSREGTPDTQDPQLVLNFE